MIAHGSSHAVGVRLQQTTIPEYRQEVVDQLHQHWGDALRIYVGDEYFDPTIRTAVRLPGNTVRVRNRFLLGRRLEWQHGLVRPLVRADSAIVEFNPRIVSTWMVLIIRRIMRRHTVLWGHAWSRRGASSPSDVVRDMMRRLSSVVLVYSDQQREELACKRPGARIITAPNALYPRHLIAAQRTGERPCVVLYSGRMVPSKKPRLLAEAFLMATEASLPEDIRLVMIGDGPERAAVERIVHSHRNAHRVSFFGRVPSVDMAPHYARALLSASPGYVGLSLIQSISFGVPMLFARDEPHAPEIEAVRHGVNAVVVASDSAREWASALVAVAGDRDAWVARRDRIAADCQDRYAVELMVERMIEAATTRTSEHASGSSQGHV
jgi:glycosyltransferase involved in cell wall biosynthesis